MCNTPIRNRLFHSNLARVNRIFDGPLLQCPYTEYELKMGQVSMLKILYALHFWTVSAPVPDGYIPDISAGWKEADHADDG